MRKYVPKPPGITFEDALRIYKLDPQARGRKELSASLPGLADNVYAQILGAPPKMDAITRRIYPSIMLNKVGVTDQDMVGACSPLKPMRGPRVWISASPQITEIPKPTRGFLVTKRPSLASLQTESHYGERARDILLVDIKTLLDAYQRDPPGDDKPIAAEVLHEDQPDRPETDTPVYDIRPFPELGSLGLPSTIRSSRDGIQLAAYLFKYTYVYAQTQ